MPIRVAIRHHTSYKYDRAVNLSPHVFRLKPAPHCRTPILSYSLRIDPGNHFMNWQQDPFGNYLGRAVFPEKTTSLNFDVEVLAEMVVINPFDFFIEKYAEQFPFDYNQQLRKELSPYFETTENGPLLKQFLSDSRPKARMGTIDFLVALNQRVWKHVKYTVRLEPGIQTCEETLMLRSGSCRDSAWLLVQLCRHLGLASRFVSGYLIQLKADQQAIEGPSGPEKDFTDLHAWGEVFIPGAGWVGLDATSGLFAGEGHIPLCCTPDPVSAAPVTGLTDVCEVTFEYKNEVFRIHEDPRVTRPYTPEQWATIVALGNMVDDHLQAGDVRLTMGGEPTFVSVDDMESKEWNTTADGPHKRRLGVDLIMRLKESFGPGGFIQKGQGKWYPGEPLPRWQFSAHWRKDGVPAWSNADLLDLNDEPSSYTMEDALRFTRELAKFLGTPEDHVEPAFEDVVFFLWEEGKVPANLDPHRSQLDDPLERKRLAELLAQGLGNPVGYVIPLERDFANNQWRSSKWKFRNQRLVLLPGDSPMGYRLPLKSLPFLSSVKKPPPFERSTFEELPPIGTFDEVVTARYNRSPNEATPPSEFLQANGRKEPEAGGEGSSKSEEKDPGPIPSFEVYHTATALCVEIRQGKVHVFMLPLTYAEHYLELLKCVELAGAKSSVRVVIEGYEPPFDSRLLKLSLSPDPGVLEVNVHPARSWKDLLSTYDTLFEEARLARLGTEKFMLDGKHTGTGGGNHVTVGGATPSDSPLLRRPDLLRSLITYWQHHPGLSYLFSSQFVGPTSQAPRVDEGRQEMLYELEIAFEQVPDKGEVPFWLVDRIFRNLLVDITGNTHRAEFCIDKLYSPDTSSGRLGLLEFRAFDMPPNKEMCIVQLLLVRCLISCFWEKPYKKKLIRWGSLLHDKFLLPHYARQDLDEVVGELQENGYPFQVSWLEPFFEFRFPLYGKIMVGDMELQIRFGIEPWNVLGEEAASSGSARFVDSSVERVEVKVTNFNVDRYVVTCKGILVPLKPTSVAGEFVAGIRYRAWSPPSALHPTLKTDVPLVFDIVDKWNSKTIGGCVYHVSHPGGRNYETFPVNAFEAEGRRISRFWNQGHTPGPITPSAPYRYVERYLEKTQIPVKFDAPPMKIASEYPHTLDLRQF